MRDMFEFAELSKDTSVADVEDHVLLKEMSHRIKNEYAGIINAISLRAHKSQSTAVRAALTDVATLLMQLSDVHRALTFPPGRQPVEVCAYLQRLCGAVSAVRLRDRNIRLLLVESEPQFLAAESCWKLGLAVSELITNSCRHAFGPVDGVIRIELSKAGPMVTCCICDNGCNRGQRPAGRGLKLVKSLVQSVGGTFDCGFGDRGAITLISMPSSGTLGGLH
ncbi:sensor histidine kinase [Bradyrhizobium sp. UFLA05-112]